MIRQFIAGLKKWVKGAPAALKAERKAVVRQIRSMSSVLPDINPLIIVASKGLVLDMGKRYRKTSGHAPLFSLFTFFANRSTS